MISGKGAVFQADGGSRPRRRLRARTLMLAAVFVLAQAPLAPASEELWRHEWPNTDFSRHSVDLADILSGGPPRDGIPAIDDPRAVPVAGHDGLPGVEPVISVTVDGEARAYPLRILVWHEIVNDVINGTPLVVTYCPLCNTGVVFEGAIDGIVLDFGVTGKLRHSDLVMYDRQTESWWQQFTGRAIVGAMTGARLKAWPSRLESFDRFRRRHPEGTVLVPGDDTRRPYGSTPYAGYDSRKKPFDFYRGDLPPGIAPLARVVRVDDTAWSLELLRQERRIVVDDLVITWEPGQASALDTREIASGFDVGNVTVQRMTQSGPVDVVYAVDFAFAWHAFFPDSPIRTTLDELGPYP